MTWTHLPDPTTILIYGLGLLVAIWLLAVVTNVLLEMRRDQQRWAAEDDAMRRLLDQHLEEPDHDHTN